MGLALSDGFAEGRATFASDEWKAVLGAIGVLFAVVALRGVRRVMTGHPLTITEVIRRRARLIGKVLFLVGLLFLCVSLVGPVAEETVESTRGSSPST